MSKLAKRILVLVIFLISFCSLATYADDTSLHLEKAETLKELGLFLGGSDGFELDREPTRGEAAAMLVRLLGAEVEAKENNYEHPFTDVPTWLEPYVGYMYKNGLTTGIGNNTYGSDKLIDAKSYITLVLRALGYSDLDGDFNWENSLEFSKNVGLLTEDEAKLISKQDFKRDELVLISYNGLKTTLNNSEDTLVEKLMIESVIRPHLAFANNMLDEKKYKTLPLVLREGKEFDLLYSEIEGYEEMDVSIIYRIGIWRKPLKKEELIAKITLDEEGKKEMRKYKKDPSELFYDRINDPYIEALYYSICVFYDEDINPVYYIEFPIKLEDGLHQLPIIPVRDW